MLKHILLPIVVVFMAMLPVKGDAQELPLAEDLQPMVQVYMDRFPESDLRDLYKYCFQDFFGPEHLISDSLGAVNYIVYELSHSDESDWKQPLFFYPLGLMGNYVRVDINYVKQGIVPMDVFVSALLRSGADGPSGGKKMEYWKTLWERIALASGMVSPRPGNWDEDSSAIAATLAEGRYALHHSARFNNTYRQHYRIIRADIFERDLLPLIANSGR
ncbi:MAG: hypothetical protein IKN84_07195 [Bacteroidales bacterium]|jgi:hypothetical protein|nr:hypothetical protein [Bacteroidales bacterium]